jgi:ferredoxin
MKQLAIDWTRCDAHGLCAEVAPALLARDEWGYPILRRPRPRDEEELSEARRAASLCPALALRIEEARPAHGEPA